MLIFPQSSDGKMEFIIWVRYNTWGRTWLAMVQPASLRSMIICGALHLPGPISHTHEILLQPFSARLLLALDELCKSHRVNNDACDQWGRCLQT